MQMGAWNFYETAGLVFGEALKVYNVGLKALSPSPEPWAWALSLSLSLSP